MRSPILTLTVSILTGWLGWSTGRWIGAGAGVGPQLTSTGSQASGISSELREASSGAAVPRIGVEEIAERMRQFQGKHDDLRRESALYELSESLASEDFPAVLAGLWDADPNLQARLLEIWAERDYEAAVEWFKEQPKKDQPELFKRWIFTWTRLNADAVMDWLANVPESERKNYENEGWMHQSGLPLSGQLAARDLRAALRLAADFPTWLSVNEVFKTWSKRDLAVATAAAEGLPTGFAKSQALPAIAGEMAAVDVVKAAEWAHRIEDVQARSKAIDEVIRRGGRENPVATAKMLRLDASTSDSNWLALSTTNPEKMIEWAQQVNEPELRAKLILNAVEFSSPPEFMDAWPLAANGSSKFDAQKLAELWVSARASSGQERPGAYLVVSRLAKTLGADEALSFIERVTSSSKMELQEPARILANTAGWDWVIEHAAAMKSGTIQEVFLDEAAQEFLREGDVDSIQSLVDRIPAGAARDRVVESLATSMLQGDPPGAFDLIRQLPDSDARLRSMLVDWIKTDRREALLWIRSTNLINDEERAQLIDAPQPTKSR